MVMPTVPARVLKGDGRTLHPWYLQQALLRRREGQVDSFLCTLSSQVRVLGAAGGRLLRRWLAWRTPTRP